MKSKHGGHKKRMFGDSLINDMPLYNVWCLMKQRCINSKQQSYKNYGARGIKVCPTWNNSFVVFYKWALKNGWQKGLDIDRKNTNGNYSPINCRIVTHKMNCQNKRNTRYVTINGKTQSVSMWCEELQLSRSKVIKLSE